MTPAPRSNAEAPPAPTTRTGRPLTAAEQDLRLFTQIDGRWRRLSGPTAQRWVVERMAQDLGMGLVELVPDGA